GIKSGTLLERGSSTSITFTAISNDVYFCTVPGHRAAGMVGNFEIVEGTISAPVIVGIVPKKNDKPLNLGFERGDLSDWKAKGEAFQEPLFTGTSSLYETDVKIGFDGDYFLSSGGTTNYKLKGNLTSVPFEVT